jgi:hypothetical protein
MYYAVVCQHAAYAAIALKTSITTRTLESEM